MPEQQQPRSWRHLERNKSFFTPLVLAQCSSRSGCPRADPASPSACTTAGALGHRLPLPGCGRDAQGGMQHSGGCVHGQGSAKARLGSCCSVAAGGEVGIGSSPPCAWSLSHIHLRDPVDERRLPGRDMATAPRVLGTGSCGVKATERGGEGKEWPWGDGDQAKVSPCTTAPA